MIVKDLIEKLKLMPENAEVAVYCEISEDSDMANTVELLSKQHGPYNKGDDVWFMYNIPKDKQIVFIK